MVGLTGPMIVRTVIFVTRAPTKSRGRPRDEALHCRRRGEILDKAADLFARHGYPNTDLEFIAGPLKISKGTIYRYFESKEQLFLAAVAWGLDRLEEHMDRAVKHIEDPLEMIAAAVRAYLEIFQSHPQLVELLIQERAEFRGRKKSVYFERGDAKRGPWRQRIEGLMAAGRVRNVPVDRVLDVIGDLMYGTMFTNHMMGRNKPYAQQAQDILDVVLNGILTDEEKSRRARLIGYSDAVSGQNRGSDGVNGGRVSSNGTRRQRKA
jgi:AcrR family transcriptional regulator